ncbi:MAG: hypothetical protein HeimC3_23550 [Candidatus Heimdallarchaeota archaeon LC_3]|nr:MAG: hypothetical protein HeimC3_23550 [Candidatus Heimdallarchaeota archaeon LC_3]
MDFLIITSNENKCQKCHFEWRKRGGISTQCPNCKTRKWYEPESNEKYFEMFGEIFILIEKNQFGKRTHVKYVLNPEPFKEEDYFPMYDIVFLSLKTKDIFSTWESEEDWSKIKSGILSFKQISREFYDVIKNGLNNDKTRSVVVKDGLVKLKFISFNFDKKTNLFIPYLSDHLTQ